MPRRRGTKNELRCFCSYQPLLATYGIDADGKLYIHVKVFKQGRIYGEVVVNGEAVVKLFCRECHRWHKVLMRPPHYAELVEEPEPPIMAGT